MALIYYITGTDSDPFEITVWMDALIYTQAIDILRALLVVLTRCKTTCTSPETHVSKK